MVSKIVQNMRDHDTLQYVTVAHNVNEIGILLGSQKNADLSTQ